MSIFDDKMHTDILAFVQDTLFHLDFKDLHRSNFVTGAWY